MSAESRQQRGITEPIRVVIDVPSELLEPASHALNGPAIPDVGEVPVVSAEAAFRALGIDRSTGYKAIRSGTFPLPIIRIGRLIRVPTVALRRLLESSAAPERAIDSPEAG